jgi:hypothetical protein
MARLTPSLFTGRVGEGYKVGSGYIFAHRYVLE